MVREERRASRRYQIQPGSFAYYALGSGAIRDLSLGGVFIEDRESSFAVGTELDLELRLGQETISLRGAVRRALPGAGFAVEFLDFPAPTRQRLEDYFRTHFTAPES